MASTIAFAKLCAQKRVVVVTKNSVFDLQDRSQRKMFLNLAEYAADELEMIMSRLGGSRRIKAEIGQFAGDVVPPGYAVRPLPNSTKLSEYYIYEPHAAIVRLIFAKFLELGRLQSVALWCNQNNVWLPPFEAQLAYMRSRSSLRNMKPVKGPEGQVLGYYILRSTVEHLLSQPMFIGQIHRYGRLVKTDPSLAIVDQDVFLAIQAMLERHQPCSRRNPPAGPGMLLLAGLMYCVAHEDGPHMLYTSTRQYRCSYENNSGLSSRQCITINSLVLDTAISQAVLGAISFSDRSASLFLSSENEPT